MAVTEKDQIIKPLNKEELHGMYIVIDPNESYALNITTDTRWNFGLSIEWDWETVNTSEHISYEIIQEDDILLVIESNKSNGICPLLSNEKYMIIWRNNHNNSIHLQIYEVNYTWGDNVEPFMYSFYVILLFILSITLYFTYKNRKDKDKNIALLPNILPLFALCHPFVDSIHGSIIFFLIFIISFILFDIIRIKFNTKYGKIIIVIFFTFSLFFIIGISGVDFYYSGEDISTALSPIEYDNQIFINEDYFKVFQTTPFDYFMFSLFSSSVMLIFLLIRILIRELLPYMIEYKREDEKRVKPC